MTTKTKAKATEREVPGWVQRGASLASTEPLSDEVRAAVLEDLAQAYREVDEAREIERAKTRRFNGLVAGAYKLGVSQRAISRVVKLSRSRIVQIVQMATDWEG